MKIYKFKQGHFQRLLQLTLYGLVLGLTYGICFYSFRSFAFAGSILMAVLISVSYYFTALALALPSLRGLSFARTFIIRTLGYGALLSAALTGVLYISALSDVKSFTNLWQQSSIFGQWISSGVLLLIIMYSVLAGGIWQLVYQLVAARNINATYSLMTGKYRDPKEEERIFLVLGFSQAGVFAPSSARLSLLVQQEILKDVGSLTEQYQVELYKTDDGVMIFNWKQDNSTSFERGVHFFWHLTRAIDGRSELYRAKYGFVPCLQGGLHFDSVVMAEMGIEQREMVMSGNGLTLAREAYHSCLKNSHCLVATEKFLAHAPSLNAALLPADVIMDSPVPDTLVYLMQKPLLQA